MAFTHPVRRHLTPLPLRSTPRDTAGTLRGLLAVVGALSLGVVVIAACSSFGSGAGGESDAATGADAGEEAGQCVPPACGGAGGRCGSVTACGLDFSCGECAPPYSCLNGTCTCSGTANVCADLGATCGEVDNGCNKTTSCGTCDAGDSCQTTDGGPLACGPGVCDEERAATTCATRCHQATNNCGKVVTCEGCQNAQLCGIEKVNTCSCPARPLALNQFYDGAGHFCYSQQTACPGVFTGAIAKIYGATTEGLVPLYRCHKGVAFMLTTSTGCEAIAGFTFEGKVGSCSKTPVCGAVPLYRFYNPTSGDVVHSRNAPAPPNYVPFGTVCHVWAN
jgi:hypothetical protein